MKKIKRFYLKGTCISALIFFLYFTSLCAQSNSGYELLISGYSKKEIYLAMQEYFDAQIGVTSKHYTLNVSNVEDYIHKQLELEEDLFQLKRYKAAWKKRPNLLDIFIYEKEKSKTESLPIKQNALKEFVSSLHSFDIPEIFYSNFEIVYKIQELENRFANLGLDSISDVSGVVNWFVSTTDRKKELFPLLLEEKVRALKLIYPPESEVVDEFAFKNYGFDSSPMNMENIYSFIEAAMLKHQHFMM